MLNLNLKYLKVENWYLWFYSIQSEMLNIQHNNLSLEIYNLILSIHHVNIFMKRVAKEM